MNSEKGASLKAGNGETPGLVAVTSGLGALRMRSTAPLTRRLIGEEAASIKEEDMLSCSDSSLSNEAWDDNDDDFFALKQTDSCGFGVTNPTALKESSHDNPLGETFAEKAARRSHTTLSKTNATWDETALGNTKSTEAFSAFVVDTMAEKTQKQVDVSHMSSAEIAALKKSDPFTYFSIPEVMTANLHHHKVDLSSLKEDECPFKSSTLYRRKSCLSFTSCDSLYLAGSVASEMDSNAIPSLKDLFFNINKDTVEDTDKDDKGLNKNAFKSFLGRYNQ